MASSKTKKCVKCGKVIIASQGYFNYPSGIQCAECGHIRSVESEQDTWPRMKSFHTHIEFSIIDASGPKVVSVKDDSGKSKIFKTRKAAERFCHKGGYMYVEIKTTYYK